MTSLSGRLDDVFRHAPALDDVEDAANQLATNEADIIWMKSDLYRLGDAISKLQSIRSRVERKVQ